MENQTTKPCNPCRHVTEGIHCPDREKNGCANRFETAETKKEIPAICTDCATFDENTKSCISPMGVCEAAMTAIDYIPEPCRTCETLESDEAGIFCPEVAGCTKIMQWAENRAETASRSNCPENNQAAAPAEEIQYYYPTEADKIQSEESLTIPICAALLALGLNHEELGLCASLIFESYSDEVSDRPKTKISFKKFEAVGLLKFNETGKCIGFAILDDDGTVETLRQRLEDGKAN
jgi:hypothetical protein